MKKKIITAACCSLALGAMAQQSYMIDRNVAVFYPADYQAEAHSPSPIFLHELVPQGPVVDNWKLTPRFDSTDSLSIVTLDINADDDLYGTGEVTGDLRRNNKDILLWNKDNYGYMANEGRNLYQSHPWVLGLRKDGSAFGVIADNTWKSRLTTNGEIRFESCGPAFRVVVIEGGSTQEVLKKLAHLTGPMELPPLWALGYQQCRWSYNPDSRVREVVDSMRINQIPCDVIWMDIDYMDQFKVFTFDEAQFPEPEALQQHVHAQKMKTVYMIDPGVKVEPGYSVYDQGKEYDFFVKNAQGEDFEGRVWPGPCHFPEFNRSEVRTWWSGLTRDFMRHGADGLWNDMNEPAVFEGVDGTMDEDAVHMVGESHYSYDSHLRYHNIYGLNMIRASREGSLLAHPDKRPFVLSRANFLGGQRYGATWNGDNMSCWEHLQQSIPMTLNLGLSGQPFNGPDMGGFGADCDAELLAHWVATGIYFPFARNHSAKGTVNQEPWAFGQKVLDVYRTAVNRRYRLMPYIYTLFREASTNGLPVMRPLFMADEKDLSLRQEQRVYLLGQDLMIIPRWAKQPALPKGKWNIIRFEEQEDDYQAFVAQRPGSIIPLANLAQNTVDYRTDSLTLLVNLDESSHAHGLLYEDAGDGFGYRKGEYSLSEISASTEGRSVKIKIEQKEGKSSSRVKYLRIGLVSDYRVIYSPWIQGPEATIKYIKAKTQGINPDKLPWSDIDIAKQPTLAEKLHIQVEKMEESGQEFEF